jgi:predicted PurR-regulated permease PerM
MYINIGTLALVVLFILGVIALVLLILVLLKNLKFYSNINSIVEKHKENIDKTLTALPKATNNILELSEDLKSISDVITDTTATVIETKDHIGEYITIVKDIVSIIRNVFAKN